MCEFHVGSSRHRLLLKSRDRLFPSVVERVPPVTWVKVKYVKRKWDLIQERIRPSSSLLNIKEPTNLNLLIRFKARKRFVLSEGAAAPLTTRQVLPYVRRPTL